MPSYEVNFVCPQCGNTELEEEVTGIVWYSTVHSFYQSEENLGDVVTDDVGEPEDYHDEAEASAYLCPMCGYKIAETPFGAFFWLRERGMLKQCNG